MNDCFAGGRPGEFASVELVIFGGEAEIMVGEGLHVGVVECAFDNLGGAFAVDFPGAVA